MPGAVRLPGQAPLKIVDTSSMRLEGFANQTEAGQLRVGQTAKVTLDAFPDLHFEGRVTRIGAIAAQGCRENYHIRAVPVVGQIRGADPRLIPDITGAATIRIAMRSAPMLVFQSDCRRPVSRPHGLGGRSPGRLESKVFSAAS